MEFTTLMVVYLLGVVIGSLVTFLCMYDIDIKELWIRRR